MANGFVEIQVEKCKGCGLCISQCPTKTLVFSTDINQNGYNYAVMQQNTCTGCGICSQMCPDAVLTVYRAKK